jgi:NAD(P)H-dependent flavin oxidoreductase YrpB (nitropropane dioxygenase family)
VVSGTGINTVLIRRLQDGDPDGSVRAALAAFPSQALVQRILDQYWIEGGRKPGTAYKLAPMFSLKPSLWLSQVNVVACFVEVHRAKQGHDGVVGLNLLEKIPLPNLSSLYGAMLAGVDAVLMGAGIPRDIPGALDLLSQHQVASTRIPVVGGAEAVMTFDPQATMEGLSDAPLRRPDFYPVVSSSVLAASLKKRATGEINGFIVEGPLAGGHNAPPRGPLQLSAEGEPIYGPRDAVDHDAMRKLGLPFWVAGSSATPETLQAVLEAGGAGVQVGTLFAFCQESGLGPSYRRTILDRIVKGESPPEGWVFTDPVSSPTGFPFKAVRLAGTLSEEELYLQRTRICDLGYLRHAYQTPEGKVGFRCPAEPVADYLKKGGLVEDTPGRKCLCNALMADIEMGQVQSSGVELSLLTAGNDLDNLSRILRGRSDYSAEDVINYMIPPAG